MQFRLADTFTASLARLPNDQQRAAKTTAFDLQTSIAHPSLHLHRAGENVVLCYVDSHDDAYRWAGRRRLETNPTTGAAQLVEWR